MLTWVLTVATVILVIVYAIGLLIYQIVAAPANSKGYLDLKLKFGCFGTFLFLFGLISVPIVIAFSEEAFPLYNRNSLERPTLLLLFYCGSAWLIILFRTSQGNLLRAAGNIKFSIRTLSIWIIFAALFAAMTAHWYQSRSLRLKLDRLRETAGVIAFDGGQRDRYVLVPIGKWSGATVTTPSQVVKHDYSYLLQLQNHEKYILEIGFYDGISKKESTAIHDLGAPQTAITYLPEFELISVHDAKVPIKSRSTLDTPGTERSFTISSNPVSGDLIQFRLPILAYGFHSSSAKQSNLTDRFWSTNPTVFELKENCDEYQMKCAYFILKEREIEK